jgi:hypothetical protein
MKKTYKDKNEQFAWDAIYKMIEIAKHEESIVWEKNWFATYCMTEEMREEWKQWFLKECTKRFRMYKTKAESEFNWFDLAYGLKINNDYDPKRKE